MRRSHSARYEQSPAIGQPVVHPSQNADRVVEVLERVDQKNRIVALRQVDCFKGAGDEAGALPSRPLAFATSSLDASTTVRSG